MFLLFCHDTTRYCKAGVALIHDLGKQISKLFCQKKRSTMVLKQSLLVPISATVFFLLLLLFLILLLLLFINFLTTNIRHSFFTFRSCTRRAKLCCLPFYSSQFHPNSNFFHPSQYGHSRNTI